MDKGGGGSGVSVGGEFGGGFDALGDSSALGDDQDGELCDAVEVGHGVAEGAGHVGVAVAVELGGV